MSFFSRRAGNQGMAGMRNITPTGTGIDGRMVWDRPGSSIQERGRNAVEPKWPQGGYVSRPVRDHSYQVQRFTGYPTTPVGSAGWFRGSLVESNTPTLRLPTLGQTMYDSTDLSTWDYAGR